MSTTEEQDKKLEQDEKILKLARAVARVAGPVLFLILVSSAIGQGGLDRLISMTMEETLIFIGILGMFFGIVWAYQNEIAGGILVIVIYIVVAFLHGKLFPNPILPIFLITGILNVYVGTMESMLRKRRKM